MLTEAFSANLANFHTFDLQNGQQSANELTSTSVENTAYCRVILVGKRAGRR